MLQSTWECGHLFKILILFPLDIYPGVLDQMVVLFFTFWGTSILFSTVAEPIYIPSTSVWGFPFLSILTKACFFLSFWWQPFWQVWGVISLRFWFAFPSGLVMLSTSACTYWPLICLLWKLNFKKLSFDFWCNIKTEYAFFSKYVSV